MTPKPGIIILGIVILLTACGAPPVGSLPPIPQPVRVALSPALRPLWVELQSCAAANPQMTLFLEEIPAQSLGSANADIAIQLGVSDKPGYTTLLGEESIVVILNANIPAQGITFVTVQALYRGETGIILLADGGTIEISVWGYPAGDDTRKVFDAAVLENAPLVKTAWLAPDPQAMLEAVAENKGAIGYLPRSWLGNVNSEFAEKIIVIELNAETANELHTPVIASTLQEPQGVARTLLACVQTGE